MLFGNVSTENWFQSLRLTTPNQSESFSIVFLAIINWYQTLSPVFGVIGNQFSIKNTLGNGFAFFFSKFYKASSLRLMINVFRFVRLYLFFLSFFYYFKDFLKEKNFRQCSCMQIGFIANLKNLEIKGRILAGPEKPGKPWITVNFYSSFGKVGKFFEKSGKVREFLYDFK